MSDPYKPMTEQEVHDLFDTRFGIHTTPKLDRCISTVINERTPRFDVEGGPTRFVFGNLIAKMQGDSERWFPALHAPDALLPLPVFYALGLAGEVGELVDEIKKAYRTDGDLTQRENLAAEAADVLTYLLLLVDAAGIDLVQAYIDKAAFNEERWGTKPKTDTQKLIDLVAALWGQRVDVDTGTIPRQLTAEQVATLNLLVESDWDAGSLP